MPRKIKYKSFLKRIKKLARAAAWKHGPVFCREIFIDVPHCSKNYLGD